MKDAIKENVEFSWLVKTLVSDKIVNKKKKNKCNILVDVKIIHIR